jgi:HK97 gp10 family phage protein
MAVTGRIDGIEELQAKLQAIGPKFDRSVRREAIRKAANVVLKEARARVPVKSGKLKKALAVSITATNEGEGARIGPRKGKGRYGHLVEKGVRPHVIRVRDKKVLAEGRRVFGKQVNHPGVKARPYLEPALEAKRDEVKRVFIAEAKKALDDLTV